MQTFIPYASIDESAACLDRQRLGKQRVECLQILRCLAGEGSTGWRHHPVMHMWRGHERALVRYALAVCAEWRRRGYRDGCGDQILALAGRHGWGQVMTAPLPAWWGRMDIHRSHRSNLLRKDPDHYHPLWAHEPDDLPYVWPSTSVDIDHA